MKIVILRNFKQEMKNTFAQKVWCDLLELRQRSYAAQFSEALILDKYDLIADHIVVYEKKSDTPFAYVRSITNFACKAGAQDLPVKPLLETLPRNHQNAFQKLIEREKTIVNMSYLCLDQNYKEVLNGIKAIDLLTWLGLRSVSETPDPLSYCATPNMKYKLTSWLEALGKKVDNLSPFKHPVIPEMHELIIIPEIADSYWKQKNAEYGKYWKNSVLISSTENAKKAA